MNILIILIAVILLACLLYFENKENRRGLIPVKTVLSLLFILMVLVQPHPMLVYYYLLLAGLCFCFVGDVLLALPQKKMFLLGLVSFLIGHVFYIIAFFYAARISVWTLVGTLIILIISVSVFLWLRPHLGSMKLPVLAYIIVITIMLSGACSVLGDSGLIRSGRIMVFAGALSFYFSDLFVARDRFLKKELLNRLIGLPMYYAGQFILAFSVGLLG